MASWSAPPLRSAFAKRAAAGAPAAGTQAAGAGEDATSAASPASARAAVPVRAGAAPRRHDSAEAAGRGVRVRGRRRVGTRRRPRGSGEGGGAGRGLARGAASDTRPGGHAAHAAPGVPRGRAREALSFQEPALPAPPSQPLTWGGAEPEVLTLLLLWPEVLRARGEPAPRCPGAGPGLEKDTWGTAAAPGGGDAGASEAAVLALGERSPRR